MRAMFTLSHLLYVVNCLLDFLGRMKHKAGDVEKRLKEKDTHGKRVVLGSVCVFVCDFLV